MKVIRWVLTIAIAMCFTLDFFACESDQCESLEHDDVILNKPSRMMSNINASPLMKYWIQENGIDSGLNDTVLIRALLDTTFLRQTGCGNPCYDAWRETIQAKYFDLNDMENFRISDIALCSLRIDLKNQKYTGQTTPWNDVKYLIVEDSGLTYYENSKVVYRRIK